MNYIYRNLSIALLCLLSSAICTSKECSVETGTRDDSLFDALKAYSANELNFKNINGIATYYRGQSEVQANWLSKLIADAHKDYSDKLQVNPPEIVLAIIDSQDWIRLELSNKVGKLYGMPFISGKEKHVLFYPVDHKGAFYQLLMSLKKNMDFKMRLFLRRNQMSFEDAVISFVKTIPYHELGHYFGACGGLYETDSHRWFREMFYTFIGQEMMKRSSSFILENWNKMFSFARKNIDPFYRSLEAFNLLTSGNKIGEVQLAGPNFFWYHAEFNRAGYKLMKRHGSLFSTKVFKLYGDLKMQHGDGLEKLSVQDFVKILNRKFGVFSFWQNQLKY